MRPFLSLAVDLVHQPCGDCCFEAQLQYFLGSETLGIQLPGVFNADLFVILIKVMY